MGFRFSERKYMYRARFQLPKGPNLTITVGANDLNEATTKAWEALPSRFVNNPGQARKSCLVNIEQVCENLRYVEA